MTITYFLQVLDNIKIYHWTTKSFPRHKASDALYGELSTLTDKFVEAYIGKYGRPNMDKKDLKIDLHPLNDTTFLKFLTNHVEYLTNELPKKLNKSDVDLFTLRDEMVIQLNQAKYLCNLS